MNKRIYIPLLIVATMLPVSAQNNRWTYDDCLQYAREHNISLKQSRLAVQNSLVALESAKAQWEPTLDFATSHSVANSPWDIGNKTTYGSNYGLNAAWKVWDGGARTNTIKRNELQTRIDSYSEASALNTIEQNILTLYINILYAREAIGINREAAATSAAQAERARQLMEAGRLSRVDYAQLNSQAESDRYSVVSAEANYNTQRMELKRLLELGLTEDITLADVEWTRDEIVAGIPPIENSYAAALACDNTLRGTDLEIEAADMDVKIAKATSSPDISLNAGIGTSYYAPGEAFGTQLKRGVSENIGVTLSIPILNQKRTKTAVSQARIQRMNAELNRQARENELAQEIEGLYIDIASAQARFTAGEQQVESALLSDELVNEQFKLGLVNTVELLTSHASLTQARHELLQAKYMTMLAKKQLEYRRTLAVTMP